MSRELLALLLEATLASSAAMALVLLLRRPLRHAFGAGVAYAAWALVPLVMLATLLPAAPAPLQTVVVPMAAPTFAAIDGAVAWRADTFAAWPWLLAWAIGAALSASLLVRRQWRFRRAIGPLHARADGLLQSDASRGLPAVVGWRPRIVLPADFDQRFDAAERTLVLAHERVHLRRGDVPAQLLLALLRVLFWFNPLLHVAAACFRHDQELACDAAVLQAFPGQRRAYGDALLKAQCDDLPQPAGCPGFGSHPLKERIAMLKHPSPSLSRRLAGRLAVGLVAVSAAVVAWAAQPAAAPEDAPMLEVALSISIDGAAPSTPTLRHPAGETFAVTGGEGDDAWSAEMVIDLQEDGTFFLRSTLRRGGELLGEPKLLFGDTGATVQIGSEGPGGKMFRIDVKAKVLPALADGLRGAAPAYPAEALAAGDGGTVMLRVHVGADGRVLETAFDAGGSTVSADSPLVRAARQAAASWRFQPAVEEGEPVARWMMVPVRFEADAPTTGALPAPLRAAHQTAAAWRAAPARVRVPENEDAC